MCLVAQSCLTLCNSMGCNLPGSFVHRIHQVRILEWVAMPHSRGSSQPRDRTQVFLTAGGFFTIWATRGLFSFNFFLVYIKFCSTKFRLSCCIFLTFLFNLIEHFFHIIILSFPKKSKFDQSILLDECNQPLMVATLPLFCYFISTLVISIYINTEVLSVSCSVVSDSATPWTVVHQAPLSVEFSRQEYWNGVPFLSPGDLPDLGIKPRSPALQANSLLSEPPGEPWCVLIHVCTFNYFFHIAP